MEKNVKYTVNSIVILIVLVAIFVFGNLILDKLDLPTIDTTQNKKYTVSDYGKEYLQGLKQPINVYNLSSVYGQFYDELEIYLDKYRQCNRDMITVEKKNLLEEPELVTKYQIYEEFPGGFCVECGDNYLVVPIDYLYSYDEDTEYLDIEKFFLAAIVQVTNEEVNFAFITGHNEKFNMDENSMSFLSEYLSQYDYKVRDVNLLNENISTENTSILVLARPDTDISDVELQKIKDYLSQGGNIFILGGIRTDSSELVNYNSLLSEFGVYMPNAQVKDEEKRIDENGDFLATLSDHEITRGMGNTSVIVAYSQPIDVDEESVLDEKKVKVDTVLSTSEKGWRKTPDSPNMVEQAEQKLAVACEKTYDNGNVAKAFVVGGTDLIDLYKLYTLNYRYDYNMAVAVNGFIWLGNRSISEELVGMASIEDKTMVLTEEQKSKARIVIFVVPALILLGGLVFCYIRKRR